MKAQILLAAFALFIVGCEQKPDIKLKKASFSQLKNWKNQNFEEVSHVFSKSCSKLQAKKDTESNIHTYEQYGKVSAWQNVCSDLKNVKGAALKGFYEQRFQVYELKDKEGSLFTGYYQPELEGRFEKTGAYTVPLHKKPDDLIRVNLGDFDEALKGQQIVGRVQKDRLKPYYKRAELENDNNALLWVKDEVEAFFLQIQGSGRVKLADGSAVQVAYAAHNGHPYTSVGKLLIEQGEMAKEDVTMSSLKKWFKENADKRKDILLSNARYIFFRLANAGPVGSQGVVLTSEYSAAIDPSIIQMGAPIFVDTTLTSNDKPFQKLMVAQDTGAAIKGGVTCKC